MKNTSKIKGVTMTKQDKIKAEVLGFLGKHGEQSQSAILRQLDLVENDRTARRAIAELIAEKAIKERKTGNKKLLKIAENSKAKTTAKLNAKSNAKSKAISKNSAKPSTKGKNSVETSAPTINAEKLLKKLSEFSKRLDELENNNAELADNIELLEISVDNIQEKMLHLERELECAISNTLPKASLNAINEFFVEFQALKDEVKAIKTQLLNAPIIKRFFK